MNHYKKFCDKDAMDFWVSWSFVLLIVIFFVWGMSAIYQQKHSNISYVETLEEQIHSLREENIDLKHELRNTIKFYTGDVRNYGIK